jgi:hypothetical protein
VRLNIGPLRLLIRRGHDWHWRIYRTPRWRNGTAYIGLFVIYW